MTQKKWPWPKKGDRLFVAGDTDESLHLKSILPHYSQHAEAFKSAAEMVIDAYTNRPRLGHRDDLFYPIVYLYRHCIELKLKDMIQLGIALRVYSETDLLKLHGAPKKRQRRDGSTSTILSNCGDS